MDVPSLSGEPMFGGVSAEPKYQPSNKATHECLRGPCRHFWKLMTRFGDMDIGDKIQVNNMAQCNAHFEAMDLAEENIYHCNLWWPASLMWMPLSLQAVLRPRLRRAWVWWLKAIGYDFSWKHWADDVFEADNKDQRGDCAPKP